jgi:hypothetical protein
MSFLKKFVLGSLVASFMFVAVSTISSLGVDAQSIPKRDVLCGAGGCPVTGDRDLSTANQDTIAGFIISIAQFLTFIVGALAVLFLVYGGFLYVFNPGGGDDNVKKGQSIVRNALIGLILAIVAYTLVSLVGGLAGSRTIISN